MVRAIRDQPFDQAGAFREFGDLDILVGLVRLHDRAGPEHHDGDAAMLTNNPASVPKETLACDAAGQLLARYSACAAGMSRAGYSRISSKSMPQSGLACCIAGSIVAFAQATTASVTCRDSIDPQSARLELDRAAIGHDVQRGAAAHHAGQLVVCGTS